MRSRVALVMAVLAVVFATTAAAPPDSFYEVPASLPAQPGAVIRTQVTNFGLNPNVDQYAVMYRSTSATGQRNAVTGSVIEPKAPWTGPGDRPVVAFAVGTQGLGDGCAPSKSIPNGLNYEQSAIQALLDKGWAVTVTDYEKLGTAGMHTYVVKDAAAHALLDSVRAAIRMPQTDVTSASPVGIMGYSQGGQAAAAAAEREATYAPELNVVGAVAGGVPSDLEKLAEFLDGSLFFSFAAFAAVGLDSAYPELDLEEYLNAEGRALLDTASDACLVDGLLLGIGRTFASLTTSDPRETPEWRARLDEQDLGNVKPQVPVLQYHALFDEIIPFDQGTTLRSKWCQKGATVQFRTYPIAEHLIGIFAGQADSVNFLDARFAGQPAASNCGGSK